MRRAVLLLALSAAFSPASAQAVRVVDDRRAEVIGILFRIAGASDFSDGNVQPYTRQVDSAFMPFRGHPVFAELNRLRGAYGISLSSVVSLAPQLTDPISFGERIPLDQPRSGLSSAWHGIESRAFLTQARDFAKVAGLEAFLARQQPVFDSAAARTQRLVDARGHLDWFARFFGEPSRDVLIVSPLLASSSGNFGADFFGESMHERYAYLAVPGSDAAGFPVLGAETLPTLIHELNHSYVNHVLDSMRTELRASGAIIFPLMQPVMSALAYTSAQTMFNESVVRAGVIRFLLANEGAVAARDETALQRGLGFVWMPELVTLLGEYEANRATYPTFSAFVSRIVSYYDGLAPRLAGLRDASERQRPRIISTSIANGARDIDPSTTRLVVTFDKPVATKYGFAGVLGPGIPELTGGTFDSTRTVFTIGMRLQPDHRYDIPFGPAFTSDDGSSNVRLDFSFQTKAVKKNGPRAQERSTIAVQVGKGWGDGTGGDFLGPHSEGGEGNISLRVPAFANGVSAVWQVEVDGLSKDRYISTVCVVRVGTSGCIPPYPDFAGATVGGGVMVTPLSRLELRAVIGVGLYQGDGRRAIGIMRGADMAIYPLPWLGIAGGWKHVTLPDYGGQWLQVSRGFADLRLRFAH